jgi:hypothetical protein
MSTTGTSIKTEMTSAVLAQNATIRMRTWPVLKACGAAVLHDSFYVLPDAAIWRSTLDRLSKVFTKCLHGFIKAKRQPRQIGVSA